MIQAFTQKNKIECSIFFERGQILPARQDVLWLVEQGNIRHLTWNEDGNRAILNFSGKGDLVGYPLSVVNPYHLECLTSVSLIPVPPHLWHENLEKIISHLQTTEELSNIIRKRGMIFRIWEFLFWLSKKFGKEVNEGTLIDLHITHQEISETLNTTRVTVTRQLQELEEQGKVLRCKRKLILPRRF
jgi:CRP-like cAMP-binding protein